MTAWQILVIVLLGVGTTAVTIEWLWPMLEKQPRCATCHDIGMIEDLSGNEDVCPQCEGLGEEDA